VAWRRLCSRARGGLGGGGSSCAGARREAVVQECVVQDHRSSLDPHEFRLGLALYGVWSGAYDK